MFDIGWTELLLIGIVALIVVGPKDLPGMFRTLGRFTAKAKGMAREFSRAMEDAADESGVKDMAGDLKKMTSSKNLGLDALDKAASEFEKWDPSKAGAAKMAPKTAEMTAERAATAKKISDSAARKATTRQAKEAAAAKAAETAKKPATKKPAAKKPAVKKAAVKKPAAPAKTTAKTSAKTTAKPKAAAKPKAKSSTKASK